MKPLEALNRYASSLSPEEIENLPEEDVLTLAMERPFHRGQFGFLLSPEYFSSPEHLAKTMFLLMQRLGKIENLKEKMDERRKEPKNNIHSSEPPKS